MIHRLDADSPELDLPNRLDYAEKSDPTDLPYIEPVFTYQISCPTRFAIVRYNLGNPEYGLRPARLF
jgi:hypothetical protein